MNQIKQKLMQLIQDELINLKNQEVKKITFKIKCINLINWVTHQTYDQKFFYSNDDRSEEVACIGYCECYEITSKENEMETIRNIQSKVKSIQNSRYYLCLAFNPNQSADKLWQPFNHGVAFLPVLELKQSKVKATLSIYLKNDTTYMRQLQQIIDNLKEDEQDDQINSIQLELKNHQPDQRKWTNQVEKVLQKIDEKSLEKVVLSRKSEFHSQTRICPFNIMQHLYQKGLNTHHFVFQHSKHWAFIGGTPENLYRREECEIQTESLAATLPRGQTNQEDQQLEEKLLSTEKLIREHGFVSKDIVKNLTRLC